MYPGLLHVKSKQRIFKSKHTHTVWPFIVIAALIYQLLPLVYPLVVLLYSLAGLVCAIVISACPLAVLFVCLFKTDRFCQIRLWSALRKKVHYERSCTSAYIHPNFTNFSEQFFCRISLATAFGTPSLVLK